MVLSSLLLLLRPYREVAGAAEHSIQFGRYVNRARAVPKQMVRGDSKQSRDFVVSAQSNDHPASTATDVRRLPLSGGGVFLA